MRTAGNWILGLYELYIRNIDCDRFAMFQDDLLMSRNVRPYLELQTPGDFPDKAYYNLYTRPENQALATREGWFLSDQHGLGALALVFDRQGVQDLLSHRSVTQWLLEPNKHWCNVDGIVLRALQPQGYREWVHNPSLIQHVEGPSTMGHPPYPSATSFRGEEWDAMELLRSKP
jgi:hypothetical protein